MGWKFDIRRMTAISASLALAGAALLGSAASAQYSRDPVCDQQKADECVSTWQSLGYWSYDHCVGHKQCWECPPLWGYMCGIGPIDGEFGTRPDEGTRPR